MRLMGGGGFRRTLTAAAFAAIGIGAFARDAAACLWDDEVLVAEAATLPCLAEAITNSYPRHTPQYFKARAEAAEIALAFDPYSTWALDMAAIARLHLGKLPEAEALMRRRAEVDPDAYATHANLGTLYTFNGQLDQALVHIDRALKLEPQAHFGREKYHRLLVVYLQRLAAEPKAGHERENFLGVPVNDDDRLNGNQARFDAYLKQHGLGRDVFDALDAMITVYGAGENPHVYAAAGDMLALFGAHGYAALAYRAAIMRKHPAAAEMKRREDAQFALVKKATAATPLGKRIVEAGEEAQPREPRDYLRAMTRPIPMGLRPGAFEKYEAFERKQVAGGLRVWTPSGVHTLYQKQDELKLRCPVGKTFPDLARAPPPPESLPARRPPAPAPSASEYAAAEASLASLDVASRRIAKARDCSEIAPALQAVRTAPPIGAMAASRVIDADEVLIRRRVEALQLLITAQLRCAQKRK